jgi:predicted enzyme related to lactoylglutathione lyase
MTATLPASIATETTSTSRFVWHELMSTDRATALAFYRDLLGWTVQPMDMGEIGEYHILRANGASFGGALELDASRGVPSHWISYISCPDVDATAARIAELGGSVHLAPKDIPYVGRFLVATDPQGAYFTAITMLPGTPTAPDSPADGVGKVPFGSPIWSELLTTDQEGAARFYSGLFGWAVEHAPMQHGGTYTLLGRGGGLPHVGGLFQKPETMPVTAWMIYFHVANADVTIAKAAEIGGTLLTPVLPVPEFGRVAWLHDPTGAAFAILEPAW